MLATGRPRCPTLLPGRSARRHQGVHQEAHRFHRQRRADRERRARASASSMRRRASLLALTLELARPSRRSSCPKRARRRSRQATCRHMIEVRTPAPEGLVAVVSRSHLDAETEAFLAGSRSPGKLRRRLLAEVSAGREGRGRRLSALRPDHGMGHCRRPCRAARRREVGYSTPTAAPSSTARPTRACATRLSSPGARRR